MKDRELRQAPNNVMQRRELLPVKCIKHDGRCRATHLSRLYDLPNVSCGCPLARRQHCCVIRVRQHILLLTDSWHALVHEHNLFRCEHLVRDMFLVKLWPFQLRPSGTSPAQRCGLTILELLNFDIGVDFGKA